LLAQQLQILLPITIVVEYLHRSHTALRNVMRNARQHYSGNSSHAQIISYIPQIRQIKIGIMSPDFVIPAIQQPAVLFNVEEHIA